MFKKKPFIVFEGIECSGKSFHSRNLVKEFKSKKIPFIYLREPGGTVTAEFIRKLILNKKRDKLDSLTDTLLYLAARNENFIKNIKSNYGKKIIVCDRFTDSTLAYQHYGFGISKDLIVNINKTILNNIRPDLTFLMIVDLKNSLLRLSKRKNLNRYDKFKGLFYKKVQKGFLKIAKKNKKKYMIIDSNNSISDNKKIIFNKLNYIIK